MANKQKSRIDISGAAESFGHNPFDSVPLSCLPATVSESASGVRSCPDPSGQPDFKGLLLRVRREKKGRAGKTVTVVYGADALPHYLAREVLEKLKKTLACGGSIENESLILQGDHPDRVCTILTEQGFRSVRCGG